MPTPLLKCFHADRHCITVFSGSPLQSLTAKPKATGRQEGTASGVSLPVPSGHGGALVSQSCLQKGLSRKTLTLGKASVSVLFQRQDLNHRSL